MRAFCQRIPVFYRVILAVLVDGVVAFGPIAAAMVITRDRVDFRVIIVMAIP